MKKLLLLVCLGLAACDGTPEATVQHGEFKVERLFTNEGCTAYRYQDGGHNVYYTNCSGTTQFETPRQCGKTPCPDTNHAQTYRN